MLIQFRYLSKTDITRFEYTNYRKNMVSVKITGNLDGLKKLTSNAKNLKDQNQTKFGDIVTKEFIQSNTNFESLDDLFEKAGFKVETEEDIEAVPQEELDNFIRENTKFKGFSDLQVEAVTEFARKQLFKGIK